MDATEFVRQFMGHERFDGFVYPCHSSTGLIPIFGVSRFGFGYQCGVYGRLLRGYLVGCNLSGGVHGYSGLCGVFLVPYPSFC